jgi:hypothetical protein
MRYTMKRDSIAPDGAMRWIIKQGRRLVGSVRRSENGDAWVGRIGEHMAVSVDPTTAFREVAAVALGFVNLAALRASNARVRMQNRVNRARARSDMLRSDPSFGPVPDEPYSG